MFRFLNDQRDSFQDRVWATNRVIKTVRLLKIKEEFGTEYDLLCQNPWVRPEIAKSSARAAELTSHELVFENRPAPTTARMPTNSVQLHFSCLSRLDAQAAEVTSDKLVFENGLLM